MRPILVYITLIVSVLLSGGLSYVAYARHLLTSGGSIAAFFVALSIGTFGGLSWLLLILVFVVSAFIATRFRLTAKSRLGLQEGKRGERGSINVVANSLPAVAVAILYFVLHNGLLAPVYLVAIASATSDTVASEIGIFDSRTRLITNMRPVPRGTDGGVSPIGTAAAFASSVFIVSVGYALLFAFHLHMNPVLIAYASAFGFLGSVIDSLLGATLERRGIIGKQINNITSIALVCILAFLLFP